MADELTISGGDKADKYEILLQQVAALIEDESDLIANLSNTAAAIWQTFGFLWVGYYRVDHDTLVLGPFQGPIACTRIPKGQGVCGECWDKARTIIVPDVAAFPGHIACSSASQSEIVVPICDHSGQVRWVLDIDSTSTDTFDATDQHYLEILAHRLGERLATG